MRLAVEAIGNLADGPTLAIERALDQFVGDIEQFSALCLWIGLVQRCAQSVGKRFFFCRPPVWVAGFPRDEGHLLINSMQLIRLLFIFVMRRTTNEKSP